jgi:hypothetical protein
MTKLLRIDVNIELVWLLLGTRKVDITVRGNDGVHFNVSGSRQNAQEMRGSRWQSMHIRSGYGGLLLNQRAGSWGSGEMEWVWSWGQVR